MRRNAPVLTVPEESIFVTPAQRLWLERASKFSGSAEEVEDWSFLSSFSNDAEDSDISGEHDSKEKSE